MSNYDILSVKDKVTYWDIKTSKKTAKQIEKLPEKIKTQLRLLAKDLKHYGPIPGTGWKNYGKLNGTGKRDLRHCHLSKGKPTYVSCWEVLDKKIKLIEVYYVGTHEKAPY